jgi:hypothetical protein
VSESGAALAIRIFGNVYVSSSHSASHYMPLSIYINVCLKNLNSRRRRRHHHHHHHHHHRQG